MPGPDAEMTSVTSAIPLETVALRILRLTAIPALLLGAIGSVSLMLRAGHNNNSLLLLFLFGLWVLSPFLLLILAERVAKTWSALARGTLYGLMLAITVGSLSIYGSVALGAPVAKTATVFVVAPPVSWLLTAAILSIAK